jgi:biotin carboxyl carrier protein
VDGRPWNVDAARIDGHTLSLVVDGVWPEGDTRARSGASYEVAVTPDGAPGRLVVRVGSIPVAVTLNGGRGRKAESARTGDGPQRLAAPMPGKVVRVLVHPGDTVRARQPLIVVEAMKMENELRAVRDGQVAKVHVEEGVSVDAGALLIELT